MRKQILVSAIFALMAMSGCTGQDDNRTEDYAINALAIVNGTQVTGTDRLNVVSLVMKNGNRYDSFCTGNLITPNYVLTAGHCVQDCEGEDMSYIREHMKIGIGQSEKSLKKVYEVAEVHWHPDFICETNDIHNDIAIVKLAEPVPTSVAIPSLIIPPSLMPTASEVNSGKLMATSVGFGLRDPYNSNTSGVKYETTWPMYAYCSRNSSGLRTSGCSSFGSSYRYKGFMFFVSSTTNICSGDSGGPTFITRDGTEYQIGVHSFGDQTCSEYAGMTNVDDYRDFIEQYVDDLAAETVENCSNGVDDNGDGRIDCDDPYCSLVDVCQEDCLNGVDDNGDGKVDCDDEKCSYLEICDEVCNNSVDDNRDGLMDCEDPRCADSIYCVPENCLNGLDDNANGLKDCEDPGCIGSVYCVPEDCTNGIDDNMNGLTDCNEASCFVLPVCQPEFCLNGIDDNGDGLVDCDDPKCKDDVDCQPKEICGNYIDDDKNGLIDCADPACMYDAACISTTPASDTEPNSGTDPGTIDCTNPNNQQLDYCQNQKESSDGCSAAPFGKTGFSGILAMLGILGMASIRRRREQH